MQSASPAECQLVEEVLAGSFLDELPARLIGDKAYDSDPLDAKLAEELGIELIALNRRGRKRRIQDVRTKSNAMAASPEDIAIVIYRAANEASNRLRYLAKPGRSSD